MVMDWLGLSLICALSVASADAVTKRYLGNYHAMEIVLLRFTLSGLMLAPLLVLTGLPSLTPTFLVIVIIMLNARY